MGLRNQMKSELIAALHPLKTWPTEAACCTVEPDSTAVSQWSTLTAQAMVEHLPNPEHMTSHADFMPDDLCPLFSG